MKTRLLLVLILFSACKQTIKNNSDKQVFGDSLDNKAANVSIDKSRFYTNKDTLIITTQNQDTLKYGMDDFNEIVDNFPALYSQYPMDPDLTFSCNDQFKDITDKNGKTKHISFSSEHGQDVYYILYAYFLRKQFDLDQYGIQRKNLIKIYNNINSINSSLNFGGTYFGHQYRRIIGYAEYSIYLYSKNRELYDRDYEISKQKYLYINNLRQFVKDELTIESRFNQGVISPENKKQLEIDLYKSIDEIDGLITDNFYLKNAQSFQYGHY
jgi:hypothetical protein